MYPKKQTPEQAVTLQALKEYQAARLVRLREALGLSQIGAARAIGVDKTRFNKWEKGTHTIDPLALQLFCEVNHVSADYVIKAMLSALPDSIRDKVLAAEMQELDAARKDPTNPKIPADIRARLAALRDGRPPGPPEPSTSGHPTKKTRKPPADAPNSVP